MERNNRIGNVLAAGLFLLSTIMALMVLLLMTAEVDEAWIIASARQGFDAAAIPQARPVSTTGGVHFVLTGLSAWLPLNPILFARALSFICMAALLAFIVREAGRWCESRTERLIILTTCLAAPGTILMAGMGYGIAMAVLLFVLGLLLPLREERLSLGTAIAAGLLVGLAMATRWTLIPALPAVLLLAAVSREHWRANLIKALLICGIAAGVLVLCIALQAMLLEGTGPVAEGASIATSAEAAGISGGLPRPARLFAFLVRFVTVLPVSLLAIAIVAYFALREERQQRRIILIFLGAAALIAVAWALRSPWMHLRYIWPAYFMISICAGLGLAALYRRASAQGYPSLALAAVVLPICLAGAQIFTALRLVAVGAAMQVNAAGYDNLENHYKPFHLFQEERAIVRYLRGETPPGTVFGTIGIAPEWSAVELALLSGREVHDFAWEPRPTATPDYIIAHRFSPFNETGQAWLKSLGDPVATIKGYTIYAFPPGHQMPDPETVMLDHQLYRFSLVRWVSLSGS